MNKIGVLYSGIGFQHQTLNNPDFRGLFIPINVYDLPTIDLRLYDAIIVPRSVDQVALNDYRRVVREFLDLPGILVVLGDYRGDTILYEDRVSTKGVILAGSQFDIFCHCFSNDEGALLALRNLVDWINEETPNIRAARKEKQIGVVYSGLHFHYDLFTRSEYDDMELIYIRRLGRTDLSRYNALIVPRESNQEVLFAEREKLVHFLERGGMIFTFGEVILPWLPGLSWKKVLPTVCLPEDADIQYKTGDVVTDNLVIEEEGHPLFEGITLDDLRWHYHGVFSPHPGQRVLLSDGRGNAIILLDEDSFTGKVVATTLDPEEHSGFGAVKITERFLARCIEWIRRESAGIEVTV